jgi:hypothetical protein
MPHIFTNAEYVDVLYVHGFHNDSVTAAVEEYCRPFPMRRILDCEEFPKAFNTLRECGMFPNAHVSSE